MKRCSPIYRLGQMVERVEHLFLCTLLPQASFKAAAKAVVANEKEEEGICEVTEPLETELPDVKPYLWDALNLIRELKIKRNW